MLNAILLTIAAIVTFVALAAGIVVVARWLPVSVSYAEQQDCLARAHAENHDPDCAKTETVWDRGLRDPIAFYTLWLTLFTLALAMGAALQSGLIARQIALAREEFLASNRPHLVVRNVRCATIEGGKPIEIAFDVVNIGGANATVVASSFETHLVDSGGTFQTIEIPVVSDPPRQAIGNPVLKPGAVWRGVYKSTEAWSPAHMKIGAGGAGFFWGGKILYRDVMEKPGRLGVFRKFEPHSHRFRGVSDPEYEYDDH